MVSLQRGGRDTQLLVTITSTFGWYVRGYHPRSTAHQKINSLD